MNSQFWDPLPLSEDLHTITAKGPLDNWKPDDAQHCKISVVLEQGGHKGHGGTGKYNHGDTSWKCGVKRDDGKPWDPTQKVDCHGTITMDYTPPDPGHWPDQTVALKVQ